MSAAPARTGGAHGPRAGDLRRVILSDSTGTLLGEVPLCTGAFPGRVSKRDAALLLLAAVGPNRSDRAPTGDALHVVIGRRACFGYAIDVDRVRWFSHPRVARADAFATLGEREVRRLLYDLHADDPDVVSEIIWETSGRIRAHRAPALPPAFAGRTGYSPARDGDGATYWTSIVEILATSLEKPPLGALRTAKLVTEPDLRFW